MASIYDFTVKDTKGNDVSLSDYKGKVLLIVNTATECGFTPQYEGLEDLYKTFKDQPFEILDFPCNQFLGQAPGSNEEIAEFCRIKYGTEFTTFAKIDVNGDNEDPLYTFLKDAQPQGIADAGTAAFLAKLETLTDVYRGANIKWNFTKFLVDKEGNIVARYEPNIEPKRFEKKIQELLEA